MEHHSLRFRQPELELLARVAGTFQWEEVPNVAGLKDEDEEVVLVWLGPSFAWNEKEFMRVSNEWGLLPGKITWATDWSLVEKTALVEVES